MTWNSNFQAWLLPLVASLGAELPGFSYQDWGKDLWAGRYQFEPRGWTERLGSATSGACSSKGLAGRRSTASWHCDMYQHTFHKRPLLSRRRLDTLQWRETLRRLLIDGVREHCKFYQSRNTGRHRTQLTRQDSESGHAPGLSLLAQSTLRCLRSLFSTVQLNIGWLIDRLNDWMTARCSFQNCLLPLFVW